jgi:hypothetical protein
MRTVRLGSTSELRWMVKADDGFLDANGQQMCRTSDGRSWTSSHRMLDVGQTKRSKVQFDRALERHVRVDYDRISSDSFLAHGLVFTT